MQAYITEALTALSFIAKNEVLSTYNNVWVGFNFNAT